MATHSSTLAWKIPWTEECSRLQSVGSQSRTRLSNFTFTFTHQEVCSKRKSNLHKCLKGNFKAKVVGERERLLSLRFALN